MNIVQSLTNVNFTPGRSGYALKYIILHTEDGNTQGSLARFKNPAAQASAHYLVSLDGSVTQAVNDGDTAWHAANWPVNCESIGIEHEDNGNYNDPVRTDALYAASAELVAEKCRQYGIPCVKVAVDGNHMPEAAGIALHREVSTTGTGCPDGLDWERVIRQAQEILGGVTAPVVEPAAASIPGVQPWGPGKVRVNVETLRVHNDPSTNDAGNFANTADGMVHAGNLIDVNGFIDAAVYTIGDQSSSRWLHTTPGHFTAALGTDFPEQNIIGAPAPEPAPQPVESTVQVSATPDYELTYVDFEDDNKQSIIVSKPLETATVAIDASGVQADMPLPAGTPIDQAGTFTHNGHQYIRTQYGKEHGTWYGIPVEAFVVPAQPETPAPVTAVPSAPSKTLDGIQAAPAEPPNDPADTVHSSVATPGKLTFAQWLASIYTAVYGFLKTYYQVVIKGTK